MSENTKPSVTASQRSLPKIKRPPTAGVSTADVKRRPQVKLVSANGNATVISARNLPLKPKALPVPVITPPTQNQSNEGSLPKRLPPPPLLRPITSTALGDQYELYLQNYLMQAITQGVHEMTTKSQLETQGAKLANFMGRLPIIQKQLLTNICVHILVHLRAFEKISGAFVNLVDFTGEEILVQIYSLLIAKFDRILVEGMSVDELLLQNDEIEMIEKELRTHLSFSNDTVSVNYLCSSFSKALKGIRMQCNRIKKISSEEKRSNRILLENMSLCCSDFVCEEKKELEAKENEPPEPKEKEEAADNEQEEAKEESESESESESDSDQSTQTQVSLTS